MDAATPEHQPRLRRASVLLDRLLDPADPEAARHPHARGVAASALTLLGLSTLSALAVPALYATTLGAAGLTTAVLVAMPFAFWLSYLLVRNGFVWASAGFSLGASAMAALVVAYVQPALAVGASVGFMLAGVLVVAAVFLPFRIAAGLALLNAVGALVTPRFLPAAGASSIEVPYVFLGVNVLLFVAYAGLRARDAQRLREAEEHVLEHWQRCVELERMADDLLARHQAEVEELRRRHNDQQAFLSAASHELRTPLTPILIQIKLLREGGGDLSPGQARRLDIVERNLERLGVLVGDLLDIARMQTGRIIVNTEPIDLAPVVREAVESFRPQADEQSVRLESAVQGPLTVEADTVRISQVLYNLLNNALKFSRPGGRVSVVAHRDLDGVYVGVQDEGPGLEEAQKDALFQPFTQLHPAVGRAPGAGLGLFVCQGILLQHQGRIWAESDGPGKGATFSFWLPQQQKVETEQAPDADPSATE